MGTEPLDPHSLGISQGLYLMLDNIRREWAGSYTEKIDVKDKDKIEERLKYLFGLSSEKTDDWFQQNVSPELLKKIYDYIPNSLKTKALEDLIDGVD